MFQMFFFSEHPSDSKCPLHLPANFWICICYSNLMWEFLGNHINNHKYMLQVFISPTVLPVPLNAILKLLSSAWLDKFRNHIIVMKLYYLEKIPPNWNSDEELLEERSMLACWWDLSVCGLTYAETRKQKKTSFAIPVMSCLPKSERAAVLPLALFLWLSAEGNPGSRVCLPGAGPSPVFLPLHGEWRDTERWKASKCSCLWTRG